MKISKKTILGHDIEAIEDSEHKDIIKKVHEAAKVNNTKLAEERNSFPLRPSSALKSRRELFYGLQNHAKPGSIPVTPIEGRNCMLLALGHVIEKHLVEFIEAAYPIAARSIRVIYGEIKDLKGVTVHELSGELDFIIKMPDGELVLCDSKSSAQFPFQGALPKEEHIAQLNLYMHSKYCRENKINRAYLWYYNKNDSNLRICEFSYDPRLAELVIQRLQGVYTDFENNKLPPLEHVLGVDWQATYSAFKDYEWSNKGYEPNSERGPASIVKASAIPTDKKAALKFVVTRYGPGVVQTDTGRIMWAELRGGTLTLVEVDSDGFS